MNNILLDDLGVAIILKEFCNNCHYRDLNHNCQNCRALKFAEFLIDKGIQKDYLFY